MYQYKTVNDLFDKNKFCSAGLIQYFKKHTVKLSWYFHRVHNTNSL